MLVVVALSGPVPLFVDCHRGCVVGVVDRTVSVRTVGIEL
jgi:hypothetical protein